MCDSSSVSIDYDKMNTRVRNQKEPTHDVAKTNVLPAAVEVVVVEEAIVAVVMKLDGEQGW